MSSSYSPIHSPRFGREETFYPFSAGPLSPGFASGNQEFVEPESPGQPEIPLEPENPWGANGLGSPQSAAAPSTPIPSEPAGASGANDQEMIFQTHVPDMMPGTYGEDTDEGPDEGPDEDLHEVVHEVVHEDVQEEENEDQRQGQVHGQFPRQRSVSERLWPAGEAGDEPMSDEPPPYEPPPYGPPLSVSILGGTLWGMIVETWKVQSQIAYGLYLVLRLTINLISVLVITVVSLALLQAIVYYNSVVPLVLNRVAAFLISVNMLLARAEAPQDVLDFSDSLTTAIVALAFRSCGAFSWSPYVCYVETAANTGRHLILGALDSWLSAFR